MSDHVEQADEEPVQGQSAVSLTPSVSHTGEGSTRKVTHPHRRLIPLFSNVRASLGELCTFRGMAA